MKESINYWLSHEEDRLIFVKFELSGANFEGPSSFQHLFNLRLILLSYILGLSYVDASFLSRFCKLVCDTYIELLLKFFTIGDEAREVRERGPSIISLRLYCTRD